jgi:serine/threonine protein phosphatase PrpC
VCFHGGRLTVCNLGDSRVVIGHQIPDKKQAEAEETKEEEKCEIDTHGVPQDVTKSSAIPGSIMAIPLTKDQTPYRKDERERVRKEGAEIKSIDQMEGREDIHDNWGDEVLGDRADIKGDPPRVWIKGQEYPGTAFTRSLGDSIAETIGVNAEAEILSVDLTVNDKYLVIASDGIFEFLTNQDVIDMCSASTNPLEACEMLTKAAYDQWLKYERRTDDISVIVCFLESDYQPSKEDEKGTTEELTEIPQTVYGTKPLRSNTKPASVEASIFEPGEDKNGESKADA